MADRREFIKLDIGYLSNPKIAGLLIDRRPLAVLVHVECMTYSRQHRTDGIVPAALALRGVIGATKKDLTAAIDAGLLIDRGDGTVEVHDYLEHQESARQIEARSAAAVKANEARWGRKRSIPDTPARSESDSEPDSRSHSEPDSDRESRGEERRGEEKKSATGTRRKPSTPLPPNWTPSDKHKQLAHTKGIDVGHEADRFRNWAQAKDQRYVDWDAAFRNWLTNARPTPGNPPRPGRPKDQLPW